MKYIHQKLLLLGLESVQENQNKAAIQKRLARRQIVIARVVAGSQAEKLGLKVNDVVLRISDQPITAPDQIRKAIAKAVQDKVEELSLGVQRGGKEMKFTIQPGQLGGGVAALFAQPVFE